MEYKLFVDYKNTEWLRNAFFKFTDKVFDISFKEWYDYGFWNDTYICYSLFDGAQMVSNVSISKMKVLINGHQKDALQLATVGTLEEYRGKGLSGYLMEKVLSQNKNDYDFFFLFANNSVLDFYPNFGFRRVLQFKFTANMPVIKSRFGARKVNIKAEDDWAIIKSISKSRLPITTCFGAMDYDPIFMWYVLNYYQECLWYIEEKSIIVVCEVIDKTLQIYDILAIENFEFIDILSYLPSEESEMIRFHFTPDLLGINVHYEPLVKNDPFFVLGNFNLEGTPFRFPKLAQA